VEKWDEECPSGGLCKLGNDITHASHNSEVTGTRRDHWPIL